MTGTTLSHLEFDLLWEHLGAGELPYPLEVAAHGHTMAARAELRDQVRESLRAKGLHDGSRVSPRLEEQLMLLAHNTFTVDAQLSVGEYVRVLAAADGEVGVLAAQTDTELRVAQVRDGRLVPAVMSMLPPEKAGPGGPARLPKAIFDAAIDDFVGGGYAGLERAMTTAGVTGRELRAVLTLVESSRHGGGQAAATRTDNLGRRTRTRVVNWFDTSAGRYLVHTETARDRVDWLTIVPADTARVEQRLTEVATAGANRPEWS
ncbi:ESX secretion-associated protein EspG [Actinophytocola sediminis]